MNKTEPKRSKKKAKNRLTAEEQELQFYKKHMIKAAKELNYSDDIIQLIQDAPSEGEITRAMMKGRSLIRS